jgi:hypothetical protein
MGWSFCGVEGFLIFNLLKMEMQGIKIDVNHFLGLGLSIYRNDFWCLCGDGTVDENYWLCTLIDGDEAFDVWAVALEPEKKVPRTFVRKYTITRPFLT